MENKNNIYPPLPSAPMVEGHNYRLQKISEIQKEVENEKKKRIHLSKKYHRAFSIISFVDSSLQASAIALGAIGIGVLTTVAGAPRDVSRFFGSCFFAKKPVFLAKKTNCFVFWFFWFVFFKLLFLF